MAARCRWGSAALPGASAVPAMAAATEGQLAAMTAAEANRPAGRLRADGAGGRRGDRTASTTTVRRPVGLVGELPPAFHGARAVVVLLHTDDQVLPTCCARWTRAAVVRPHRGPARRSPAVRHASAGRAAGDCWPAGHGLHRPVGRGGDTSGGVRRCHAEYSTRGTDRRPAKDSADRRDAYPGLGFDPAPRSGRWRVGRGRGVGARTRPTRTPGSPGRGPSQRGSAGTDEFRAGRRTPADGPPARQAAQRPTSVRLAATWPTCKRRATTRRRQGLPRPDRGRRSAREDWTTR